MLSSDRTIVHRANSLLIPMLLMTLTYALTSQNEVVKTETSFSCEGRPSGYYADVETGCQVYHMCDGLGRQFSYSCPNTTLFQQRMLICDHWYMVNCTHSELDYGANLLIGQRDKPFVDDSEHTYHRTPRPDLLNQPYPLDYADRRPKAQQLTNRNKLVGVDTENETRDGERQYFLPSHWSTEFTNVAKSLTTETPKLVRNKPNVVKESIKTTPNFPGKQAQSKQFNLQAQIVEKQKFKNIPKDIIPPNNVYKIPSKLSENLPTELIPPRFNYSNNHINYKTNEEVKINETFKVKDTIKSAPIPTLKIFTNNPQINQIAQSTITETRFKTGSTPSIEITTKKSIEIQPINKNIHVPTKIPLISPIDPLAPSTELQPPKRTSFKEIEISTSDPLTFYNIVPSKELLPPNEVEIDRSDKNVPTESSVNNQSPRSIPTDSPKPEVEKIVGESKIRDLRKAFFIPEYDFPLDNIERPGYDSFSSYQVNPAGNAKLKNISTPKRGDLNPDCPICDPEVLVPGTCQPCVLIRR